MDEVPALVEQALERGFVEEEDWRKAYFDRLPALVGLAPGIAAGAAFGAERSLTTLWRPVPPYQRPEHMRIEGDTILFEGAPLSTDEWCYLSAGDEDRPWRDFAWTLEFRKLTDFRELAFNFRCRDFDNRYRFRFELDRLYFDKRVDGRWHNHLASVPFAIVPGTWYRLRIDAVGERFTCSVNGAPVLHASDGALEAGNISVILWESDGATALRAAIRDAAIRPAELPGG
jgi:hypothetical protein